MQGNEAPNYSWWPRERWGRKKEGGGRRGWRRNFHLRAMASMGSRPLSRAFPMARQWLLATWPGDGDECAYEIRASPFQDSELQWVEFSTTQLQPKARDSFLTWISSGVRLNVGRYWLWRNSTYWLPCKYSARVKSRSAVEPPVSGHPRDLVQVSAYGRLPCHHEKNGT